MQTRERRKEKGLIIALIYAPVLPSPLPTPIAFSQFFFIMCFRFFDHRICFPRINSISPLDFRACCFFFFNTLLSFLPLFIRQLLLILQDYAQLLPLRRFAWLPTPPKGDLDVLFAHPFSPLCFFLLEH